MRSHRFDATVKREGPQRFSSARACSRFVAEGSLLPGVGRSAWIAVIGGFAWLGSHAGAVARDASRAGFPKAEAQLRALKKRDGRERLQACSPPSTGSAGLWPATPIRWHREA